MVKTTVQDQNETVVIKLIRVEGQVKALVLDLSRVDGRLLYIGQGADADEASRDAQDYISAMLAGWQ